MEEFFKNIKQMIEEADKLKDMLKLNNDINEGEMLKKYGNKYQKEEYVNRIEQEYYMYISTINMVNSKREEIYGANSVRYLKNINEIIDYYIRILDLIRAGKLYEELFKMVYENLMKRRIRNEIK